MDKKRLRAALTVSESVKTKVPETKQFIDNIMEDKRQKEKISADKVNLFQVKKQRVSLEKYFVLQWVC